MWSISAYASTFSGGAASSRVHRAAFMGLIVAQTSGALALQTWHLCAAARSSLGLDVCADPDFCLRRLSYERLLE